MKSNQKSMKWGVDLRAQRGKQGRNHRDEWLKKRRSCNTILDAHIKNLTPKKGQLVRLYTNMLFWSQNQVHFQSASARNMAFCWQAICSKPNLVNMLLFHDTIHQTHPNPCKTHHFQRLLRFHGTSPGIWTFQPPFERWVESSLFLTSQYVLMVSMDLKIQSNISVFVTNPWNLSNSINTLISTSHSDLRGVAAPWLRPECEIWWRHAFVSSNVQAVVENWKQNIIQNPFKCNN